MFMSENIYTMVDLFDKAVAEGASNHWKRDRKVTMIDRQTDRFVANKNFLKEVRLEGR